MLVDQGVLNKVWTKWIDSTQTGYNYEPRDYARVARRGSMARKFEDWLWQEGAAIRRANKKCFLEFHSEDDATAFVLRYS